VNGKIIGGFLVLSGLLAGIAMYWLQVYAFYEPVSFAPGNEIRLTPIISQVPEVIVANDVSGIDATSSPLRFRACFTTPLSQAMLTETYVVYDSAEPLVAPGWFDCFDAMAIGKALETGEAIAFLSEKNINSKTDAAGVLQPSGIDRVVAVMPDGHAYAWHQLNDILKD
jgi:hypothetical protein